MDMNNHTHEYAHNGEVMLASAILFFLIFLIVVLLKTFANICFRRRYTNRPHRQTQRLFPNLPPAPAPAPASTTSKGLDPSLFKFLPTFTYSSATHRSLPECAVCLSEFEDGDEGCVLPNCNHCFHTHCIYKWFRSHSSCPICRAPVEPKKIWSQRTEECVSEGEIGACLNLPPPIGCPRKGFDLEVVSVIIDRSGLRSSGSGPPEESRMKNSDEHILRMKTIWHGAVQ